MPPPWLTSRRAFGKAAGGGCEDTLPSVLGVLAGGGAVGPSRATVRQTRVLSASDRSVIRPARRRQASGRGTEKLGRRTLESRPCRGLVACTEYAGGPVKGRPHQRKMLLAGLREAAIPPRSAKPERPGQRPALLGRERKVQPGSLPHSGSLTKSLPAIVAAPKPSQIPAWADLRH